MERNLGYCLYVREWLVVYLFLFLLISLTVLSFTKKNSLIAPQKTITVTVIGCVENEMKLEMHPLSTVADLLCKVTLCEDADCGKLIISEQVRPGLFIIPKRGKISIYVTGEVEKRGLYYLEESCRFNQLENEIALTQDADRRYFSRKRRLVQEGETVVVPKNKRK